MWFKCSEVSHLSIRRNNYFCISDVIHIIYKFHVYNTDIVLECTYFSLNQIDTEFNVWILNDFITGEPAIITFVGGTFLGKTSASGSCRKVFAQASIQEGLGKLSGSEFYRKSRPFPEKENILNSDSYRGKRI